MTNFSFSGVHSRLTVMLASTFYQILITQGGTAPAAARLVFPFKNCKDKNFRPYVACRVTNVFGNFPRENPSSRSNLQETIFPFLENLVGLCQ